MEKKSLFVALASGLGLTLALLWILGSSSPSVAAAPSAGRVEVPSAAATELHVCATCTHTTVQAAVDAASTDDVIKVAAGDYTDVQARAGISQVV